MMEHRATSADEAPSRGTNRRKLILLLSVAAAAAAVPGWAQGEKKPFSPEELDQMLAPIALYPDSLLSQILMASGYPLEIVEAARWQQANPGTKGDVAIKAVADKGWDVSVKSLVAFPDVLKQLNEHLDWTQKLGDALIGQQADVAASIQRLRGKAAEAGNLKSGKEQTVTTTPPAQGGGEPVYAIEPANPETVYVPSYDPNNAYGQWPSSGYPPTYYPPMGGALMRGLTWGVGIAAAGAMFSSWNWNGNNGNYVNVNASRATNIDRNFNSANVGQGGRWQHQAEHRKGVAYRDPATRQQFNQNRPGAEQRQQFRGQVGDARPGGAGGPGGVGGAGRPGGPGGVGGAGRPGGPGGTGGPGGVGGAGGAGRPGGPGSVGGAGGPGGAGSARPNAQPRGPSGGGGGGGLSGVDRGQQVNREAQRGRQQQQRAAQPRSGGGGGGARASGGAGGGGRGGGGGGRGGSGGGRGGGAGGGGGGGRR